jgi:hypothetical protein
VAHPSKRCSAYRITRDGFDAVFGKESGCIRTPAEKKLNHTLQVAEAVIELSRYESVSGFATEFELSKEHLQLFSYSKAPDAIIQLTRDGHRYEVALEVELHPKSDSRVDDFLSKYQKAFEQGALCRGVILVCHRQGAFVQFRNALEKGPSSLSDRFLIIHGPTLPRLNSEVYGERRKHPGICAEKERTISGGGFQYLPIKSASDHFVAGSIPTQSGIVTSKQQIKEETQIILR